MLLIGELYMNLETKFEINPQKVISETLDGETIIINLETGTYYSMNETASLVWNDLQSGYSIQKIEEHMGVLFEIQDKNIKQSILDFIKILEADNLIIGSEVISDVSVQNEAVHQKPYSVPAIEKYEDMQEMLLADPIHDVDVAGWPKRKEG